MKFKLFSWIHVDLSAVFFLTVHVYFYYFTKCFFLQHLVTSCAKCYASKYHFTHHNLTVSAGDRGNGMWKWVYSIEVQQWRLQTAVKRDRSKETRRRGGQAMLRDILLCLFGLGLKIDIFQSDEALTWVIQPLHHCDMQFFANAHSCWWAHPLPQGPWPTYPPSSVPICACVTRPSLFFYFYCPSPLFSITMSCPITVRLDRHSVG